MAMIPKKLWAISSYYNPTGSQRRRAAYDEFRRHLRVPLLTVEYSSSGDFALADADADILVRLRGESVLWQKERLLNVALSHLPEQVRSVAWLDCDVVFCNMDWAEQVEACLRTFALAQCFSECCDLGPAATVAEQVTHSALPSYPSIGQMLADGEASVGTLLPATGRGERTVGMGLAWAARREVLERHRFYDVMVTGGGDRAMIAAALGQFDHAITVSAMSPPQAERYLAWARPFHQAIGGRIGVVPGRLLHVWHGAIRNRRYLVRHQDLAQAGFDPNRHLELGAGGAWEWSSAAPAELRDVLRTFFVLRKEDEE